MRPAYVGRVLTNLNKQTDVTVEMILCANGFKVSTEELQCGSDRPVRTLVFAKQVTLGEMLNRGVYEARGEYICKWDDDDFYGREFLAEAYKVLRGTSSKLVGKASWYAWMEQRRE